MIKYIKTIIQERSELLKGCRILTDLLGVFSVFVGYVLLTNLYTHCFCETVCAVLQNNGMLFWALLPLAFLLSVTAGQLLVFGLCGAVFVMTGKLSAVEAFRFSVLYRMPKKWLGNNA